MHFGDPEHLAAHRLELLVHKRPDGEYSLESVLLGECLYPPDLSRFLSDMKNSKSRRKMLAPFLLTEPTDTWHIVTTRYIGRWNLAIASVRRE